MCEDFGLRGIAGLRRRIHPWQGLQRRLCDRGLYILIAAQLDFRHFLGVRYEAMLL